MFFTPTRKICVHIRRFKNGTILRFFKDLIVIESQEIVGPFPRRGFEFTYGLRTTIRIEEYGAELRWLRRVDIWHVQFGRLLAWTERHTMLSFFKPERISG